MNNENKIKSIIEEIEALIKDGKEAEYDDVGVALRFYSLALEMAEKNDLTSQICECHIRVGNCKYLSGSYEISIKHFRTAYDLSNKLGDDYRKGYALNGLGIVHVKIKLIEQAITYFNKAQSITKKNNFPVLESRTNNNLGLLYEDIENYEKALKFYSKGLEKTIENKDFLGAAIGNFNVGNMSHVLNENSAAKKYLIKAEKYAIKNKQRVFLAHIHYVYGLMSKKIEEYDKSIQNFSNAIDFAAESKDLHILYLTYIQLAGVYVIISDFNKAKEIYKKAEMVTEIMGVDELKAFLYGKIALSYKKNSDDPKSLEYFVKYYDANMRCEEVKIKQQIEAVEYQTKLSVSLEETKLYQKLSDEIKNSYDNIKTISDIGRTMTSTLNMNEIFESLYDNINSLMTAETLSVGIYDSKEDLLRFDLSIEKGKHLKSNTVSINDRNSLSVWSYLNKQIIKLDDVETEYKIYIDNFETPRGEFMHSVMVAPMIIDNRVIGTVSVQSKEKNTYTETHKVLLSTLSSYLAIAVNNASITRELAKVNKILKRKSNNDGLTGIPNRRLFDESYASFWDEYLDSNQQIGVMIIDIDNFKKFNDKYGHLIGDEVLKSVARVLDEHKSEDDFIARYGGDEFIVIIRNSAPNLIQKFDENIRESVRSVNENIGIDLEVTISIGIALTHPTKTMDKEKLVYTADNQMYKSKAKGKNISSIEII